MSVAVGGAGFESMTPDENIIYGQYGRCPVMFNLNMVSAVAKLTESRGLSNRIRVNDH